MYNFDELEMDYQESKIRIIKIITDISRILLIPLGQLGKSPPQPST